MEYLLADSLVLGFVMALGWLRALKQVQDLRMQLRLQKAKDLE
jgi:hypothetical protein